MGKYLLTALLAASIIGTPIADLSYIHAGNEAWPPHARLHAIWAVLNVMATHGIALALIWVGENARSIFRIRIAIMILLAYVMSFFASLAIAPIFDASAAPDLPAHQMPPTLFGLDGNVVSFLIAIPVIAYAWWLCERKAKAEA